MFGGQISARRSNVDTVPTIDVSVIDVLVLEDGNAVPTGSNVQQRRVGVRPCTRSDPVHHHDFRFPFQQRR